MPFNAQPPGAGETRPSRPGRSDAFSRALDRERREGSGRRCDRCGDACGPFVSLCDPCRHAEAQRRAAGFPSTVHPSFVGVDPAGDDRERTILTQETTEGDHHTSTRITKNGRGRVLEIRRETRVANVLRQLVETTYSYRGMLAIETENTYRPGAEGALVLAHTRTTEGVFTQESDRAYTGSTSMGIGRGFVLPHTPSWGVPGLEGDTEELARERRAGRAFSPLPIESDTEADVAQHPEGFFNRIDSALQRAHDRIFGARPSAPRPPRPPRPVGERPAAVNPDPLVKSSRPPLPKRKIITD